MIAKRIVAPPLLKTGATLSTDFKIMRYAGQPLRRVVAKDGKIEFKCWQTIERKGGRDKGESMEDNLL